MGLDYIRRTYERWGEDDPMHAVLTRRGFAGGQWDANEFFGHGRAEIDALVEDLDRLGVDIRGGRALDFGCGVGRLSQALAGYAREVVGLDIADSMVAAAREWNRHGDRVRYVVNRSPDLAQFEAASFDFVYSNITLQHVPPRYARRYIAEFFRVVRPGGCVVFQMRHGPRIEPRTLRSLIYRINREPLRHLFQRIRGRPPYEIHFIAREQVEDIVARSGGRLIDVTQIDLRRVKNFRYAAIRAQ